MLYSSDLEVRSLNRNTPANLDLAQSLQSFQGTVASVLVLGDVSKWDGRTLQQREQQIRQAALILAGQCISLLLHTLAQSSTAHTAAASLTQGWRLPNTNGHGKRRVQVLTLGNVVVSLWLPYIVERSPSSNQTKAGKRKKPNGLAVLPVFKVVGHGRPHYALSMVYSSSVWNASVHMNAAARDTKHRLGGLYESQTS